MKVYRAYTIRRRELDASVALKHYFRDSNTHLGARQADGHIYLTEDEASIQVAMWNGTIPDENGNRLEDGHWYEVCTDDIRDTEEAVTPYLPGLTDANIAWREARFLSHDGKKYWVRTDANGAPIPAPKPQDAAKYAYAEDWDAPTGGN